MNEEELQRFVERLADREALDWNTAERRLGPSQLRGLRRIESIVSAYRRFDEPATSQHFQRLLLQERLGGGLGGEVWRAYDPLLERNVALKLRGSEVREVRREARLLEEARALARIDHPNVLRVLGADLADGRLGIWSEFVDGEDLGVRMRRDGRIGIEEARSLGAALCGALAAVHGAGFVHGDVKPANVMRTRDGRYVLCDLGSAVALQRDGERAQALASGSPLYLAPEVLDGGPPSVASDLYALGASLFHLLGGRAPVEGDDLEQLLAAHRAGRRHHLRDLRPELPRDLLDAIERAIDPDPRRRFASAGAFEAALNPRPAPRRRAYATALVAAIALFAAFVWRAQVSAPLASEVRWLRGDGTPLFDGDRVRQGDTLHLQLRCARACWTYVYAEDGARAVSALFPLPATSGNPQAARTTLDLPGTVDAEPRHWRVGPTEGIDERVLLIVADAALNALEKPAKTVALADDSRYRGIDAVVVAPTAMPAGGLDTLAAQAAQQAHAHAETHWLRLRRGDYAQAHPIQSR